MYKITRRINVEDPIYFDEEFTGIDELDHALSVIRDDSQSIRGDKWIEYDYYDVDGNPDADGGITIAYTNGLAKVRIKVTGRIGDTLESSIELEGFDKYGDDWDFTINLDHDHDSIAVHRDYCKYTHSYSFTIIIYEYAPTALTLLLSAYDYHQSTEDR